MIDSDESEDETVPIEDRIPTNCTDSEINEYRKQLENEVTFSEIKQSGSTDNSIRRYIESCSQYLGNITLGSETEISESTTFPNVIQTLQSDFSALENKDKKEEQEELALDQIRNTSNTVSVSSNDLKTGDEITELINVDPNSRMYRLKMVEKLLSDTRSQRSYSTAASTIAPSVVTDRIKRNMDVKEKRDMRKRCVAKGEASAVHRHRKENQDVVKEYAGWDF